MTTEELKAHCKRQIEQFERIEKIMPVTPNDWKRYEEHKLVLELLEQEPCDDCISRQAVIDIVNNPLNIKLDEIIKKLPPVTPKRLKGKWESDGRDHIYCTACKQTNVSKWKSAFCPSCGADMREVSE